MSRIPFLTVLLAAGVALPAAAQDPNPRGAVRAEVGEAVVTIDHGRPGLGDRMLADLLAMLPEERVWRAGENQVTILETSADIRIGGQAIPAGRYSLYLHIPTDDAPWSLLVNRHQGIALGELWAEAPEAMRAEPWPMLSGYAAIADQEVARIPLSADDAGSVGDTFEIAWTGDSLRFTWGPAAYTVAVSGS